MINQYILAILKKIISHPESIILMKKVEHSNSFIYCTKYKSF